MLDVALLPTPPGQGLAGLIVLRAAFDDPGHVLTELPSDGVGQALGELILDRIVEQPRNRLVLGSAVLQNRSGDAQEVPDVGHARTLPPLVSMQLDRPFERELQAIGDDEVRRGHVAILRRPPTHPPRVGGRTCQVANARRQALRDREARRCQKLGAPPD